MTRPRVVSRLLAFLLLSATAPALLGTSGCSTSRGERATIAEPEYGEAFWSRWGDGKAELAGYELTYPRYGELRRGTAVSIVVTETFSLDSRVKNESEGLPGARRLPVLKLNLVQDFATGIYDYNLMTSAFVGLKAEGGRAAGLPTKVSFSSQEWCGQVYAQLLFDARDVRLTSHSYFDGEADQQIELDYPADGFSEDTLWLWARGLAAPALEPGQRTEVRLLRSLERARLQHLPLAWDRAVLSRSEETTRISVPAGTFDVVTRTATVEAAIERRSYPPSRPEIELPTRIWTFEVEAAPPHRIVRWSRDDGLRAELVGSERASYWSMNGEAYRDAVKRLGLSPRPARTP